MKKKFLDMDICDKSHKHNIEVFCTQCSEWVCTNCKTLHLEHEGLLKDFEELTNSNIQIYAEHLRQLKIFFKKLDQIPNDLDYDEVKSEIALKISNAYDQLILQLAKHKETQLKKVCDYIELTKRKRQKMQEEVKQFEESVDGLQKILFKLKKCNVNKIPKEHLIKYNNIDRLKYHDDCIENVKKAMERCGRMRDKFIQLKTVEIKVQLKDSYLSKIIQIPNDFKQEPWLMLIQPKSRNIIVANLDTMKKRLMTINEKTFKFPEYFEFVEVKHKIILCGGDNGIQRHLSNTYEIMGNSGDVRELANMEIPKKFHALVVLSKDFIYSLGGQGTTGPLKTTEMLDLNSNQWIMQCPLNEQREGATACCLNQKLIYCIGGRGDDSEIYSTIEILDTSFPKMGWTLVQLQTDKITPMYFGMCWSISNKHILISGGMTAGDIPLAGAYILDAETYGVTEIKPMQLPDYFLERAKKFYKGKIYSIGYASYAIHIFDTERQEWNIIKSSPSGPTEESKSFA